ncbi:MAG: GMC family oxidoreductase [Calothrix sp. MO_192.B10]|nr:GMC family oxidoreductase [Calothrix sp. MO_192.B10]
MKFISPEQASRRSYDVVIVGGGITGSIVAKQLANAKKSVLIVEAGTGGDIKYSGYLKFLHKYYRSTAKIPNAPYPKNPNAPEPTVLDPTPIQPGHPSDKGYFVQMGPLPFRSSYTTYLGGTTLHWLGTALRMLPDDFAIHRRYGVGRDWPITYEELRPYYEMAEKELGVSANVQEQTYSGVKFDDGYVYPMHGLPKSWSDQYIARAVDGLEVAGIESDGQPLTLKVRGTPAARNGIPNDQYEGGKGYQPRGAAGDPGIGHRCMGNSSCVPICPIQAKYNALRTLSSIKDDSVDILTQSVATRLVIDSASELITGIECKHYETPNSPTYKVWRVQGKRYVLAAHAVANAVLLLASGACQSSGLVGRHLMDHPELLTWGRATQPLWPFRGPLSTSGIEDLRGGSFRRIHAPFRMEMGNDGWSWPAGAPSSDVVNLVDNGNLYGHRLRQRLHNDVSQQFRFGILVEQLPEYDNRVTLDPAYLDALGNFRPVIHYNLSPYTRAGFAKARQVSQQIFQRVGLADYSQYSTTDPGYFTYEDQDYVFQGAGHFAGTHCMGTTPQNSVVNPRQRAWDHANLYLVGCGNMVTLGTSNPTLTASALSFWAAENILADLQENLLPDLDGDSGRLETS